MIYSVNEDRLLHLEVYISFVFRIRKIREFEAYFFCNIS